MKRAVELDPKFASAYANLGYEEFFALWKDVDPDTRLLREAKAEFANLDPASAHIRPLGLGRSQSFVRLVD
jgi:hypothetical protein